MQYWQQRENKNLLRVITFMERVEDFTLDNDPQIEKGLKELGDNLERIHMVNLASLNIDKDLIHLLSCISTKRMLYIMKVLDKHHPGTASRLLMLAESLSEDDEDVYTVF